MPRRLSLNDRLNRQMTERQLGLILLDVAHLYGWLAVHWRPASNQRGHWATNYQGDGRGFPDWLLLKDDQLLAVELERETAHCPAEQVDYLQRFQRVRRGRGFIWRPHDTQQNMARVLAGGESDSLDLGDDPGLSWGDHGN